LRERESERGQSSINKGEKRGNGVDEERVDVEKRSTPQPRPTEPKNTKPNQKEKKD
jgi:hypothetical protein